MDLTNTQRQARYREKQSYEKSDRRLNTWIDAKSFAVLDDISGAYGLTKREALENILVWLSQDDLFFKEKLQALKKKPKQLKKPK